MKKIKLPDKVKKLINTFQQAGFEIYLVGGSARGLITGHKIADWDFATNASPEEMLKLFPKNSFYHNQFGTVSIVMGPKKDDVLEVTTYRTERGYSDRRRPDKVTWGKTVEEDLSRRDFTINAIAIKLKTQNSKLKIETIIDPFEGQKDLKKKVIRAVGDPNKRFQEDALRLLRAVRIATQLGFVIEPKTFTSIQKNAFLIQEIAWERIRDELLKLLASRHPADGILLLYNSGLLKYILPELLEARGVAQAKHHIYDVWTHLIESLRYCPSKDPIVRLATLLHDIGKPATAKGEGEERTFYNHEVVGAIMVKKIGRRLRLSNRQLDRLWRLVRWHQFTPNENQTDKAIRRFIRRVGQENLQDILDVRVGDRLGSGVPRTSWRLELFKKRLAEVQKQPFSVKDLKVNGHDVMTILKIKPGPMVGKILQALFEEVEDNKEKNQRQYLLSRIPEIYQQLNPHNHRRQRAAIECQTTKRGVAVKVEE